MHNGDEMSENPQAPPSVVEEFGIMFPATQIPVIGKVRKRGNVVFYEPRPRNRRLDMADADLVWWIQMGGTCCFLVGVVCLLVAHILGRP